MYCTVQYTLKSGIANTVSRVIAEPGSSQQGNMMIPKQLLRRRGVGLLCDPDVMEQNCQLTCHGNDSFVLGPLAPSVGQMKAPLSEGGVFSLRAAYMVGTLNQRASQQSKATEVLATIVRSQVGLHHRSSFEGYPPGGYPGRKLH